MTEVTIVTATRDRVNWLSRSLESVALAALHAGVRVRQIVVDDASVDRRTALVCDRAHVDYVRLEVPVGTSHARVVGYGMVESPFVAFFDDDDVMLPTWFERHLEMAREGYDVVSSAHWNCDADLQRQTLRVLAVPTLADLMAGRITANDGSLIRRSALAGIPWRPERENVMMYSMWLALAARGARFGMVHEPTWLYRWHDRNQTHTARGERDAAFRAEAVAEFSGVPV